MDFEFIVKMIPQMLPALKNTLLIALLSAVIGWFFGILIALIRVKQVKILSRIFTVYVSFMRSVPLVIIMFFCYFAIPTLIAYYRFEHGLPVANTAGSTSLICPIAAMSLAEKAFSSETFRSALTAIPHQAYFRIIFPQAFIVALPNMCGLFIGLIKSSTLAYYSGVVEITGFAYTLASPTYQFLEAFFVIALLYELLSFIFSKLIGFFEHRLSKYKAGISLG